MDDQDHVEIKDPVEIPFDVIEAVIVEPMRAESIIISDHVEMEDPGAVENLPEDDIFSLTDWNNVPDLYESSDIEDLDSSDFNEDSLDEDSLDEDSFSLDEDIECIIIDDDGNTLVQNGRQIDREGEMSQEIIGAYYTMIYFKYGGKISIPFVSRNFGRYRVSISYISRRNAIFLCPRIKMGLDTIEPIHSFIQEKKDFLIASHDFQVNFIGRGKFKMEIPSVFDLFRDYPSVDDFFRLKQSTLGLYFRPRDLEGYPQCRFIQDIPSRFEIEIRLYALI